MATSSPEAIKGSRDSAAALKDAVVRGHVAKEGLHKKNPRVSSIAEVWGRAAGEQTQTGRAVPHGQLMALSSPQ